MSANNAPMLVSGGNYSITNQNTGTMMFYDDITNQVLGYVGTNTVWTAHHVSGSGPWTFSTSGVYMGYQGGPFDGNPIIGVADPTLPNTQFDVWPASAPSDDVAHHNLTINIPNTLLQLQLAISHPVPGIPVLMSINENSDLQMWDFLTVGLPSTV